jgi:hypothetical protein
VLAELMLGAGLAHQFCASCGVVKDKVLLCAAHAEEERAAFDDTHKALASRLGAERSAALMTLGRLTHAHVNAPYRQPRDASERTTQEQAHER